MGPKSRRTCLLFAALAAIEAGAAGVCLHAWLARGELAGLLCGVPAVWAVGLAAGIAGSLWTGALTIRGDAPAGGDEDDEQDDADWWKHGPPGDAGGDTKGA